MIVSNFTAEVLNTGMNDQKKDSTDSRAGEEVSPGRDPEQDAAKTRGRLDEAFFETEKAGDTPYIPVLDTPAEAPPELDIDLIEVPILTEVVEWEEDQGKDSKKSDR